MEQQKPPTKPMISTVNKEAAPQVQKEGLVPTTMMNQKK
jgi:hypothetical protein